MLNGYAFIRTYLLIACLVTIAGYSTRAQTLNWAKGIGGTGSEQGNAIVVDGAGNVYVAGTFSDTVDFDPGPGIARLRTAGSYDIFLAKYDANGRYIWAKSMGRKLADDGFGVTCDKAGYVYITGRFQDTVDFDPGPDTAWVIARAGTDIFIAKYDTAGNYVWAKGMGGPGTEEGRAIAVDGAGNVYVTGFFTSTVDFDPDPASVANRTSAGSNDVFLAKYSASGNYLWAGSMGGGTSSSYNDQSYGMAVDGSGNAYITGVFYLKADFDPDTTKVANLNAKGIYDVFLAKYDSSGKYVWAKNMGGPNFDYGQSVTLDGAGNIYITGRFIGTSDFDPDTTKLANLISAGNKYDVFLAKYDSAGNYIWAKSMGGTGDDYGQGVATDAVNNVYITGWFGGASDYDPDTPGTAILTSANNFDFDVFLAKYDSSGHYLWAGSMGTANLLDEGFGVATDGKGNAYCTGYFEATAYFSPAFGTADSLTAAAATDIFMLKLGCNDTTSFHITEVRCGESSYTLNGETYTASGIYTQHLPNAAGCDSILTLDLTLSQISKPVINVSGYVLSVTGTYTTYQWIGGDTSLPGATGSAYTVTVNGNYRVAVTNQDGCTDTSDVYTVTNVGMGSVPGINDRIYVYPNPAHDLVYIQSPVNIDAELVGMEGKVIQEIKDARMLSLSRIADGIYLLRIKSKDGALIKTEKIVKQRK